MWDALLFVGHRELCWGGSAVVLCLFLLSVLLQLIFTVLIWENLTDSHFDDELIEALKHWRLRVAHEVDYMDKVTGRSLAERVCSLDFAAEVSTFQLSILETIYDYLPQDTEGKLFSGYQVGWLLRYLPRAKASSLKCDAASGEWKLLGLTQAR
eukprot:1893018-Amphidinium_carterae.1